MEKDEVIDKIVAMSDSEIYMFFGVLLANEPEVMKTMIDKFEKMR